MLAHRPDRSQRFSVQRANAFGDQTELAAHFNRVRIDQHVQVMKAGAFHMPVKILSLDEQRKMIGKQAVKFIDQRGF